MTTDAGTLLAFIEIPRGSRNKYEYDEATATFRLDRLLCSSVRTLTDEGFIPETLAPDGDHLDALVVQEPTFPGCLIAIRPLGGHWLREIETFCATDKLLEPKRTEVLGRPDLDERSEVIARRRQAFDETPA